MQVFTISTPCRHHFFQQFSKSLILIMLFISTTSFAAGGGGGPVIADGKANYLTLEPAFVVNVMDGKKMRFMQLSLDLMSMDSHAIQAVQDHRAPIRHELLMLFTHRDISDIIGLPQREKLRQDALERIQTALLKYASIDSTSKAKTEDGHEYTTGIQEVLFTNFVIQ